MGPKVGRKRQHHSIRDNSRKVRTRARTLDLDQIFKNVAAPQVQEINTELPGSGQFYCIGCARHFIDAGVMEIHERTKAHKKRAKTLKNDTPYSQKEADLAAGLGSV